MKYFPVFDLVRDKATDLQQELVNNNYGHIVDNAQDADVILVAGGDGFMLDTIKKHCCYYNTSKQNPLFFGVNCGTLGFLLNDIDSLANLPQNLESIYVTRAHLMQVCIYKKDGTSSVLYAINDVVIWGNITDYFRFEVTSENRQWDIAGTGLLFSTSVGTTAYWMSNGGPLIPTGSDLWWMMGIASRPFHYKTIKKQELTILPKGRMPVSCVVDGYAGKVDDVEKIIISPTEHEVHIGFTDNFEHKRILLAEQKM